MSEAARLAAYGRRTFHRNGWAYRILTIRVEDDRLLVWCEFTELETSRILVEEIRFTNPPILVPDGEEEIDGVMVPKFREDHIEAIKIHLERGLAAALADRG